MVAVVAATVVDPLPRAAGVAVAMAVDLVVVGITAVMAIAPGSPVAKAVDPVAVASVRRAALPGIPAAVATAELATTEIATAVDNLVSMATAPPVAAAIGPPVTTGSTEAV